MPFAPVSFWAFQTRATFWWFLKNFSWSPLCTFSENAGLGWPCKNCHTSAIRALLEPPSALKSSPVFARYVHTSSGIMPFAPECFWAFQTKATFRAMFEKFPLVPPLHSFRKFGFWVTLQKIAITQPSGHFWSRCLRQNHFHSLYVKCKLIRG